MKIKTGLPYFRKKAMYKFDTQHRQDISHLYSETGRLRSDRIIAFVYQNKLPGGLVQALLALAKALIWRSDGHDSDPPVS